MIDALKMTALAGVAIAFAGGFALGTLFGRKLVADLAAIVHSLESRLTAVESSIATAKAVQPAASAQTLHTAAIEHHAQATDKLASAIQSGATAAAKLAASK
ncbi:MAG: hypothetical protein ACREQR_10290 [Candidatus Binataceae bacterium]